MPEPKWAGRVPPADSGSGGGGATTLTELADVTGEPGPGKSPVYDGNTGMAPLTRVTTEDDLDAILGQVAEVEWDVVGAADGPPFLSGFRPTGDPWAVPRFRRTLNNVVHIEGQITNDDQTAGAATWLPMFQLPPDCLPGMPLRYGCLANDNSIGKVIVWTDGLVLWGGYVLGPGAPGIPYVSLDTIHFSVGAS